MSWWYETGLGTTASFRRGLGLEFEAPISPIFLDLPLPGEVTAQAPIGRVCPPGEHSVLDTPTPEYLDGVLVTFPPQEVCVPDDPLEMVLPPGTPPCATNPIRQVTRKSGEKGPWSCPGMCSGGKAAVLTSNLQWVCPPGSSMLQTAQATASGAQTAAPMAQLRHRRLWPWVLGGVVIAGVGGYLGYRLLKGND